MNKRARAREIETLHHVQSELADLGLIIAAVPAILIGRQGPMTAEGVASRGDKIE